MEIPDALKISIYCAYVFLQMFPSANAAGQDYPAKPIRYIVPFPPGGGNDVLARELGAHLSEVLGQPVVIDNRAGASTIIGTEMAAKSPSDGYTILMGNNSALAINVALFKKLPYDAVKDFAPVSLLASAPFVLLIHPAVKAKTVKELVVLALAQPGRLHFASAGTGISTHLAGELFKTLAKIDIVHVPYRGSGPALTETMGGQVEMLFNNVVSSLPYIKAGRLRPLGVTSTSRSAALPEIPTVEEAGGLKGYEAGVWYGVVAPANTPKTIIAKLNAAFTQVLVNPRVRERLNADGAIIIGGTPERFRQVMLSDIKKWSDVIKQAGISLDKFE